jgi:hypothetical protein
MAMGANAAKLHWDTSMTPLMSHSASMSEHVPVLSGTFGRVVTLIPRALGSLDAFFAETNYAAFVQREAYIDAFSRGSARGLKGEALNVFIKDELKNVKTVAYKPLEASSVVVQLRERGYKFGYRDDKLDQWVRIQLNKNKDLFRRAESEAGRNYVGDIALNRALSGKGTLSKGLKKWEEFANSHPAMKLLQPFFRSLVRMAETGINMTPGFNMLNPVFLGDLAGARGKAAQVKAKGMMFFGYAVFCFVAYKWATGEYVGGGPKDYTVKGHTFDDGSKRPYSIKIGDNWISTDGLDPIAFPMKLWANTLDRFTDLQKRQAQGENVDGQTSELVQYLTFGAASFAQSMSDLNLAAGVNQIGDLMNDLSSGDTDTFGNRLVKFLGKKAQMLYPSTLSDAVKVFDKTQTSPSTLEQYLLAKSMPSGTSPLTGAKVAQQYNILGKPRKNPNNFMAFFGVNIASESDMKSDLSEQERVVLAGVADLENSVGIKLDFPKKMPGIDIDLTATMTSDGKQTLYDRAQQIYSEKLNVPMLYQIFKNNMGAEGTESSHDASRTNAVTEIIRKTQKYAFAVMMQEERNIKAQSILNIIHEAEAKSGQLDTWIKPY